MPVIAFLPVWLRLHFASAANPRPRLASPGQPGILCVALPSQTGPADILVWDEDGNTGASVTNVMESVLGYLGQAWAPAIDVRGSRIVERDSAADYDEVMPTMLPGGRLGVQWRALTFAGYAARSEQAFAAKYPGLAEAVRVVRAQASSA